MNTFSIYFRSHAALRAEIARLRKLIARQLARRTDVIRRTTLNRSKSHDLLLRAAERLEKSKRAGDRALAKEILAFTPKLLPRSIQPLVRMSGDTE